MTILTAAVAAAGTMDDVRLYGPVADRMNACIANHVCATDPMYYAREFRYPHFSEIEMNVV